MKTRIVGLPEMGVTNGLVLAWTDHVLDCVSVSMDRTTPNQLAWTDHGLARG